MIVATLTILAGTGRGEYGDHTCRSPQFTDDTAVAKDHQRGRHDEQGHELVDGKGHCPVVTLLETVVRGDGGLVIVVRHRVGALCGE